MKSVWVCFVCVCVGVGGGGRGVAERYLPF